MERERRSFTVEFKLSVIKYAEENSGEAAARHFEIDSKTVRTWKKRKAELETLAATKEGERKRITKGHRKSKKEKSNETQHDNIQQRLSVLELCNGDLCANCLAALQNDKITNIKVYEPFSEEDKYVVIMDAIATVFQISWSHFLKRVKSKGGSRSRKNDKDVSLHVALCKNCALFLEEIYSAYSSFQNLSHSNSLITRAKQGDKVPEPSDDEEEEEEEEEEDGSENPHVKTNDDLFDDFHFDDGPSVSDDDVEQDVKYSDAVHVDLKVPPECIISQEEGDKGEGEEEKRVRPKRLAATEVKRIMDFDSDQDSDNVDTTQIKKETRGRRKKKEREKKKEYKCDVCEETFQLKTKLLQHSRVHRQPKPPSRSKSGPFPCQICGKVFKNREYVRKHERKRHSRQNVQCPECGKVMKNESTLAYHLKTIHISQEEKDKMKTCCEVCGKSMLLLALKQHMLLHTTVRNRFQCSKCEKAFSTEERLQFHLEAHLSTTVHTCGECGRSFPIPQYLKEHEENHHKTEKPFGCESCPMRFKSKSKAEDHKRIHCPEKAFVCEECGKSCATQKHLNQHVKCHRDEEKGPEAFKCPDCGKCFKNRYCLYAHKIRSHRTDLIAGKRIFSCHICGKSLYDERNLKKHIEAVHNKDKSGPRQETIRQDVRQDGLSHDTRHTDHHFSSPTFVHSQLPMHSAFLL